MNKIIIIIGLVLAFAFGLMLYGYVAEPVKETILTSEISEPPGISAREAILIDDNGQSIYEKNADEKGYPASTTKIMTTLVALEICEEQGISIKQKVVIPKVAEGVEGSSLYLEKGEKCTIEKLLYGIMLCSGNDGATALAATLGGSVKNFVKRMNQKAAKLGCSNTHFVNPSGLFDEDHYTTARDLSKISEEAMKNKVFREIVGSSTWHDYSNKNKTIYQYKGATGIKIGFTKNSGRTLVASAKRDGTELICVVLSDGNWFNDAYALMDYGFELKGDKNE